MKEIIKDVLHSPTFYSTLIGIVVGGVLSFFTGWTMFYFQKKKDKRNKLFELHGMLIENLNLLRYIISYSQCTLLMFYFHKRRMELTKEYLVKLKLDPNVGADIKNAHIESLNRDLDGAKDDLEFHTKDLSNWRSMLVHEKAKLQKYFYQINGYVNIMDLEGDLRKILNFVIITSFTFKSIKTTTELFRLDITELQEGIEKDLEKRYAPITEKLYNDVYKRIK